MQNSVKFIFSIFATIALIFLLFLFTSFSIWLIVPCMIPAIVLFWKQDTLIKRGALAALILGIASLGILLYAATALKIEF